MNKKTVLLTILITISCIRLGLATPSADDLRRAEKLASQLSDPSYRVGVQRYVAFEAAFAPSRSTGANDVAVSRTIWQTYLEKLILIDVSDCPEAFKAAFDSHVSAIKAALKYLRDTPADGAEFFLKSLSRAAENKPLLEPESEHLGTREDVLQAMARTMQNVDNMAKKSKSNHPSVSDNHVEEQISDLLHK